MIRLVATDSIHELLSALLAYPDAECIRRAEKCVAALSPAHPEATGAVEKFIGGMKGKSIEEMEETHIRVFDWNPHCALEVGWHLFGEDYNRGAFLVKMREEMRRLGVRENGELPDHLTHALAVVERMEPEKAEDFVRACVLPAVDKMIDGLGRLDESPYRHVLEAIKLFLEQTSAEGES